MNRKRWTSTWVKRAKATISQQFLCETDTKIIQERVRRKEVVAEDWTVGSLQFPFQLSVLLLFLGVLLCLLFQEGHQFLPQCPHLESQAAQLAQQLDIHSAEVPLGWEGAVMGVPLQTAKG